MEVQIFMEVNVQVLLLQRECLLLMKCVNCVLIIVTLFLILSLFFFFILHCFFFQVFTLMVVICFKRECLISASLMSDKRCQVGPTFLVSGILLEKKKNNSKNYIHITIERKKNIYFLKYKLTCAS